jgi:archaetidylinositol phosphate synthase
MMPILARFRTLYEHATIPLGRMCLRLGLTPNVLTLISLMIGGLAGLAISRGRFVSGVALIILMGVADMLDGATARAGDLASSFGTVLDHVVDRYAEFMILLGVMLSGAASAGWVMFALFGMVMASYVRARAESTGSVESCNVGFAGRQEKLVLLCLGMLAQSLFPRFALLEWAVIAVGAVSHVTAVQRLLYTRRVLLGGHEDQRVRERRERPGSEKTPAA